MRNGTRSSNAPSELIDPTSLRGAPFGVPVVPLVSITTVGLTPPASTGVDGEAAISSSSVACAPPASPESVHAPVVALGPIRRAVVVLLVEDQRRDPLALADVVDLRAGELRVHIDGAQARLGGGVGRIGEAAVIAAEDRDRVARLDARPPATRSRARSSARRSRGR